MSNKTELNELHEWKRMTEKAQNKLCFTYWDFPLYSTNIRANDHKICASTNEIISIILMFDFFMLVFEMVSLFGCRVLFGKGSGWGFLLASEAPIVNRESNPCYTCLNLGRRLSDQSTSLTWFGIISTQATLPIKMYWDKQGHIYAFSLYKYRCATCGSIAKRSPATRVARVWFHAGARSATVPCG